MNKSFYLIVFFLLILADIILFTQSSDIRMFGLLLVYGLLVKILRLGSSTAFLFSLIFLILAYFQFVFSSTTYFINPGPDIPFSEKAAIWAFLFMIVGVFEKWRE